MILLEANLDEFGNALRRIVADTGVKSSSDRCRIDSDPLTDSAAMQYAKHIMCLMKYGLKDAGTTNLTQNVVNMTANLKLGQPIDQKLHTDNESVDPLPPLLAESKKKPEETFQQSPKAIEYPSIHIRRWSHPLSPGDCNAAVSRLIVLVSSAPDRLTSRNAIRSTWGGREIVSHSQSRLIFVVGLTNDSQLQKQLEQESDKHQDILQVDTYDSYYNLSLKTIGMLNWVKDHCQSTAFVAKIDDDMMAGIPNIVKFAEIGRAHV